MKQGVMIAALLVMLFGVSVTAQADKKADRVFGWVEKATLEPWGVEVKAKLDTGALTSSLHASDIERFEKADKKWVRFTVDVENEATGKEVAKTFEKPVYRDVTLRGAGGESHRPVVIMAICMAGVIHEEQFSLRDRGGMIYPLLIGRRAIQHLGLVDVTRTFLNDPDCDEDSPLIRFDPDNADEDIGA